MPLNPGGSDDNPDGAADNEGPHCRNCHTGASSCNQCHGTSATGDPAWYFRPITAIAGVNDVTNLPSGGGNPYMHQQYVHTSAEAATDPNAQCIDGGFSWPHRTLGANLLKDELYGVDFDGSQIFAGDVRGDASGYDLYNYGHSTFQGPNAASGDTWQSPYATNLSEGTTSTVLINPVGSASITGGALVQNLDSVCIDCHGDATFWNGDDTSYFYGKWYPGGTTTIVRGEGWQLMLKGLP